MIDDQIATQSPFPSTASVNTLLASLTSVAQALVATLGDVCEVVIHDLSDRSNLDHTIVAIAGNVTGRQVGGPPTDVLLRRLRSQDQLSDFMVYSSVTNDGRTLKSSTTFIRNAQGEVVGSFCVNLDITRIVAAKAVLDDLCSVDEDVARLESPEVFASAVNETLDAMVDDAIQRTGKLVPHMDKDDKVRVVRHLEMRGAFLIRRAVDQVAKRLGVSRYTVYNYLNEVRAGSI